MTTTPELYTNGRALLFRERRRQTALPSDAPPAYAKSQLGDKTLAYMRAQGWLDGPRVVRLHQPPHQPQRDTAPAAGRVAV
jgi:hypothetical protein